ncbi:jg15425 [Pararge aegeria aegeria]|uniref:Jg15425 protein n=1 Tax=Pararge aegeria aegeria TaxID=348720 RepID=A0A8S4SAS7_9NEOP|nr:jg15425 [Pararge aegeria aegeria]
MKRTYRSKKETGGCLDPRDVVLAMDEKASVFDAFYIKNIKQTKREMSVGASMFAASNKVRKRKYVKRLKDQEPIRDTGESSTRSGYLTPDKSIHLKRALDPFDLLLNSSSTNSVTSQPVNNVFSPLCTRGKGKSYRKKKPFKKKFQFSSRETDSCEENDSSKSNLTQNLSDVLSHKLEIEQEEKIIPTDIDQSINNIVNDLSLLDKIQNLNSVSYLSSTVKDNSSLSLVKSPLCSTPFHKKYRGKSIYKLSPISLCDNNIMRPEKFKETYEAEDKNYENSIKNATISFQSPEQKNMADIEINSPILQTRDVIDKNKLKEVEMLKHYSQLSLLQTSEEEPFLGFSTSTSKSTQNIHLEAIMNKYKEMKKKTCDGLQLSLSYGEITKIAEIDISNMKENKNNPYSNVEHDNEANPSPHTTNDSITEKSFENVKSKQLLSNIISKTTNTLENNKSRNEISLGDKTIQYHQLEQDNINESLDETSSLAHSEGNSINDSEYSVNEPNTSEPIYQIYSTQNNIAENEVEIFEPSQTYSGENSFNENEHSNEEDYSLSSQAYLKENSIIDGEIDSNEENTSEHKQTEPNSTIIIEYSLNDKNTSSNSTDNESFYESCNSENEISEMATDNKELLVVLERLNDSLFNKYNTKEADSSYDSSQSDERNYESYSSEISSSKYTSINENDSLLECIKSSSDEESQENDLREDIKMNLSNTAVNEDYNYENNKSDEEPFVSFVTKRKRNEITKDSFLLSFEDSPTSSSSGDFDKTVLSKNKFSIGSLQEYNDNTLISDACKINNVSADNICDSQFLLEKENTIIEADGQNEIPQLTEMKRSSGNIAVLRKSFKLSDSVDRKSVPSRNRKSRTITIRKSNKSKVSIDSVSRQSIHEENDILSRNSVPHTNVTTRKSSRLYRESLNTTPTLTAQEVAPQKFGGKTCQNMDNDISTCNIKQGIVLEPGKRWERSLSIYRRVTTMGDQFDQSILDEEQINNKGRKYRQSVINTIEMQDISVSLHNESIKSRRSTIYSKPSRSTIKILRESNASRISLSTTAYDDLECMHLSLQYTGFLTEDCDDTIVELSKLSIIDSEHEVTLLDKFNDTSNRITTARDYVLRRCNQTDVIPFDECYPDPVLKNCRKIGEGVYGEVFLWRAADGRARVLKIVPIAGDTKVNGESQKDYHEIISEIVIAM